MLCPCVRVCIRMRLANWRLSDSAISSQRTLESSRFLATADANYSHFRRIEISGKLSSYISWPASFFTSKIMHIERQILRAKRESIFFPPLLYYIYQWSLMSVHLALTGVITFILYSEGLGFWYDLWELLFSLVFSLIFFRSTSGKYWYILKWATIIPISWGCDWMHSMLNCRMRWILDLIRLYTFFFFLFATHLGACSHFGA
jgi:hypothetical protein